MPAQDDPRGARPGQPTPAARRFSRRSLLGRGALAGAGAVLPATMLPAAARAEDAASVAMEDFRFGRRRLSRGDAAMLRFLAAAEILETDLWQQYNELANGNPDYKEALEVLDDDMPEYITQNTVDEQSHAEFLNAFLVSMRERPVNLDAFRTLPSSPATGAANIGRLTNLAHLNVDTSWYARYRSAGNPDFGDTFPQVVNIVNRPGIPLHDGYTDTQIQAIANTAAFHFAMIEQGGSSLYDAMSLFADDTTVLRIITSIGGTEVAHFEIWHDKVGDAPPLDTGDGLVFPDLNADEETETSKVMPRPCKFISAGLPLCSVIRPTSLRLAGAMAAVRFLTDTGLFQGQSRAFFNTLAALAREADHAGH
ncbi:MAG TPA: hypothetical protein VFU47_00180 [Armatimonadota bacterium]|nr:hypothetical protein [Armatimonadota bacterium]